MYILTAPRGHSNEAAPFCPKRLLSAEGGRLSNQQARQIAFRCHLHNANFWLLMKGKSLKTLSSHLKFEVVRVIKSTNARRAVNGEEQIS
jgi:hypothetical protein